MATSVFTKNTLPQKEKRKRKKEGRASHGAGTSAFKQHTQKRPSVSLSNTLTQTKDPRKAQKRPTPDTKET